jgi:uncharacterized protein YbbC (DUF1343 family)
MRPLRLLLALAFLLPVALRAQTRASAPPRALPLVELGIDVLEKDHYALLQGKRVGLVTNQTGVDSLGRPTRDLLRHAPGVRLVKLFSPEHGIDGVVGAGLYVQAVRDALTGLDVYSLYDRTRKPTPAMLRGIDVLVFDMQDIGVRSYTYVSTMVKCMEAAGENHIPFVVLDRPNPLDGVRIEGPPVEPHWLSFVGQIPVPYVHGMTVAELARMTNDRGWNGAKCHLVVVPMRGWRRTMAWPETGLHWVRTSPNIPNPTTPVYYVVTGLAGSLSGLNIGIGTPEPFQRIAAPGLAAGPFAAKLNALGFRGFQAVPFTDPHVGWQGATLLIDPHTSANLCAMGIALLAQANRSGHLFDRSSRTSINLFCKVYGSAGLQGDLEAGRSVASIVAGWQPSVDAFRQARMPYLLY